MKLYPVVGINYLITEWDGSKNEVEVKAVDAKKDMISFEYVDVGLLHYVSADYFAFELNAYGMV